MRYPFRTVEGTPALQPLNIGITLVAEPMPVAAMPASTAPVDVVPPDATPHVIWRDVRTVTPSDTDPLVLQAPPGYGDWALYAQNQVFFQRVNALVKNVDFDDVITWTLNELNYTNAIEFPGDYAVPDFALYRPEPDVSRLMTGSANNFFYEILVFAGQDYRDAGSTINLTLTAHRNGVPMNPLQLFVS